MKILIYILVIFGISQFSFAGEGVLSITDVWARPVILQNRPGAAYFTITNHTNAADKLISVTSALAARVEIHVHRHEGDVMKMMQVEDIPVPAQEIVAVEPGGYHLMLFGLSRKLALGDQLPLILTFDHAGEIKVIAKIMKKAP